MKSICIYCHKHTSGNIKSKGTSHGMCSWCFKAMKQALDGHLVEIKYFDPRNELNDCYVDIKKVSQAVTLSQEMQGRLCNDIKLSKN